ncbi:MAG: radical SAM protein [Bacteroidales bacterium]|nr:radical SAM protein [Bacteroidales bacterium]
MINYRLSSYTIFIKLEKASEKYMLIHGYTGAIDVASKQIVKYLKENGSFINLQSDGLNDDTLKLLISRGYITTKTLREEREYVKKLANLMHRKDKSLFKNFMFLISYDCNFRCPYCYENEISGEGHQWTKRKFTKELVDKAFYAMEQIEPRAELRSRQSILYGGEPLLKENKEIVEYIVSRAQKFGMTFMAITNGYDLDHYEDLLSPEKINTLQITIDGFKEEHDNRRIHYLTGRSFDKIVKNIGIALKKDIAVAIRYNTDKNNISDIKKILNYFDELGYSKFEKFAFKSALLKDYSPDANNKSAVLNYLNREEFNRINYKQLEFNGNKYGCQDFGIYNKLSKAIKEKRKIYLNSTFCAAQSGSYIFDPYGNIYGCWSLVGNPQNVIGKYSDKIQWTPELSRWHARNINGSENCSVCKYALLCSGGCLHLSITRNKDINSNYCDGYSNTFKYAANKAYEECVMPAMQ